MSKRKRPRFRIWFWALLLLLAGVIVAGKPLLKSVFPLEYEDVLLEEAKNNNLEPAFVCAIIWTESKFDPDAVSHADARGFMQITPETFSWIQTKLPGSESLSEKDIVDPAVNIRFGTWYFRYLLDRYEGEKETALCAYNAGPGRVDDWLKDPECSSDGRTLTSIPIEETRKYVDSVMHTQKIYEFLYKDDIL